MEKADINILPSRSRREMRYENPASVIMIGDFSYRMNPPFRSRNNGWIKIEYDLTTAIAVKQKICHGKNITAFAVKGKTSR